MCLRAPTASRRGQGRERELVRVAVTTVAAERSLREMGRRGAKQRAVVDQSAATILLQGYLDANKGGTWKDPESL